MNHIMELTEEEIEKKFEQVNKDKTYYAILLNGKEYYAISNFITPNRFIEKERINKRKINEIQEKINQLNLKIEIKKKDISNILKEMLQQQNYDNTTKTRQMLNIQEEIKKINENIEENKNKKIELDKQISNAKNRDISIINQSENKTIQIFSQNNILSEIEIESNNQKERFKSNFYSKLIEDQKTQINLQKRMNENKNKVEKMIYPDVITYNCRTAKNKDEKVIVTTGYPGEKQLFQKRPSIIKILIENINKNTSEEYNIKIIDNVKAKLVDKKGKERAINIAMFEKKHGINIQPKKEILEKYAETNQMKINDILNKEVIEIYSIIKQKEEEEKNVTRKSKEKSH